jgi:hypothetical protein
MQAALQPWLEGFRNEFAPGYCEDPTNQQELMAQMDYCRHDDTSGGSTCSMLGQHVLQRRDTTSQVGHHSL